MILQVLFPFLTPSIITALNLATSSTRSLLILPQAQQQLPKLLLSSSTRTTLNTLPTQINQLRNTLPGGSTRSSILPISQELLCVPMGLSDGFLLLRVVVLVEIIDVLLGVFNGFFLAGCRLLGAFLERELPAFAPLLDYFGLFFVGECRGGVVGLVGCRRACDGATWCYVLFGAIVSLCNVCW
jgi:hypothetical protein